MAKRITREKFIEWASSDRGFCASGLKWLVRGKFTPQQACRRCERPAWMLWTIYSIDVEGYTGPAHQAAAACGWQENYIEDRINRPACDAIRKAIPWPRIAKRLAEVIGD